MQMCNMQERIEWCISIIDWNKSPVPNRIIKDHLRKHYHRTTRGKIDQL